MSDSTVVTGAPPGAGALQRGDVLAERYEIAEMLDAIGPSIAYRALDQESERHVLLHTLNSGELDKQTLEDVVARLRGLVGVGGRYLSPILDADRERRLPFTVEAWPPGAPIASVLSSREGRGRLLNIEEVLPVVARLSAALAALPAGWHHGDVRMEQVWVSPEGLRLTGGFLLASLPLAVVNELPPGTAVLAPERRRGKVGEAADRWGAAAIAWRALTGSFPDPKIIREGHASMQEPLRAVFARALDPEPQRRPLSLDTLMNALATQSGLPVPSLDPESHRPPTALLTPPPTAKSGRRLDEGTQELSMDQIEDSRPSPGRKIDGADREGTQEIHADELIPDSGASPDDTAPHVPVLDTRGPDSLDPRLVRAALGVEDANSNEISANGLDPRLVRAALGVDLESSSGSYEALELEAPKPVPKPIVSPVPPPRRTPAPPKPRASKPVPRPQKPSEPARPEPPKPRPTEPVRSEPPKPRAAEPVRPEPPKPRPAEPVRRSDPPKPPAAAVERSEPPKPRPPQPARRSDPPRPVIARPPPRATSFPTPPMETKAAPREQPTRMGLWIVAIALMLALGIVAGGFWIAERRRAERRSREIDERLEQLQRQD